jgi:hypothetical protein
MSRATIDVGNIAPGASFSENVVVRRLNSDVDIVEAVSTAPDVHVRMDRIANGVSLRLDGVATSARGLFGNVVIRTTRDYLPELRIPFRGSLKSE